MRRLPSYTVLPLLSFTSQMPCGRLGSPPLRMSSMRKVRARGIVSRTSRAHLCVMCEGHITSVVLGRPSASTWIVPSAMKVLPAPHSATMRAALGPAQILRSPGDGKCLRRERLAQKCCERRSDGVFRALQWRVGFENALGQCGAKLSQVVEGRLHRDTSGKLGYWGL